VPGAASGIAITPNLKTGPYRCVTNADLSTPPPPDTALSFPVVQAFDASCQNQVTVTPTTTTGALTISDYTADSNISGQFDYRFSGDRLQGSFSATFCDGVPVTPPTASCQ
jgi:hypothetical protein